MHPFWESGSAAQVRSIRSADWSTIPTRSKAGATSPSSKGFGIHSTFLSSLRTTLTRLHWVNTGKARGAAQSDSMQSLWGQVLAQRLLLMDRSIAVLMARIPKADINWSIQADRNVIAATAA